MEKVTKQKKPVVFGGKQYPNIEAYGKEWWEEKKKLNWQKTDVGILPPEEIALSGMIKQRDGSWAIPGQLYVAESTTGSIKKGQKFWGPTRQFIDWKNRYYPKAELDVEDYDNFNELSQGKPLDNDEDIMKEVLDLL